MSQLVKEFIGPRDSVISDDSVSNRPEVDILKLNFMYRLLTSDIERGTIKPEWKDYYESLSDVEKLEVWQTFYSTQLLDETQKAKVKIKSLSKKSSVVALVPAHNEQDIIKDTIESLMSQTLPLDYALIIADNCSDDTVAIVKKCQMKYGQEKLKIMETALNTHKKAGALNQGFMSLKGINRPEFIFGMDADTILDSKIIEAGVNQFKNEPNTAGICSAYRTLPPPVNVSRWQRFLWRLQNIEFGLANAWRVENYKSARVLPGVSVIFRTKALDDLYNAHEGIVWATDSLVEDYRLTLELKDLGWDVKSSLDMISWSDVPLKISGKGGLFDQRQRWYSGTVDEIRKRGLKKNSRYEVFTISLMSFNLIMRFMLYGTYILIALNGGVIQWLTFFLVLPVAAATLQFYRWIKYTDQRDKWQGLMTITLIPNEIYAIFREITYTYSIWLSYRKPNRAW